MHGMQTGAARQMPRPTEFEWLTIDTVEAPPLQAGAAYWRSLCAGRPFPTRREIVPRAIAKLLSNMSLVKVIDGGRDLEHRIVGDAVVRAFHAPLQNRRFSEIAEELPEFRDGCLPLFFQVLETGAPVAWRATSGHDTPHSGFNRGEVLLLPLGENGIVDHILGFGDYKTTSPR